MSSRIDATPNITRHRSFPADHRDRIRKLPDSVLSHVLSRLPIIDAVRTCVLSKCWEFKWTMVTKLKIDVEEFPIGSRDEPTFLSVVERVLFHIHTLKNFSLSCSCYTTDGLSRIAMLISAILRRNVSCLHLAISINQDFVLPRGLLNCSSLTELYLNFWNCSFKVPVDQHFPNLKIFSLSGVKILNEISDTDTLNFSFPVLKILELRCCKWVKVKSVSIYAPSLRTFSSETPYELDDNIDFSIRVYGANLAELNSSGGYTENILMIDSTVDVFNLECFGFSTSLSLEEYGLRVRKLLRELSNLKQLCVMDVLGAIGRTTLGLPIPRFCNLKVMHLAFTIDGDGLLELLHASPFLKKLELLIKQDEYDYDSVENVPSCVVHHLEELTVYYEKELKPNYLVEKFLLRNGAQLKKLSIANLDEFQENEMLEKMSMFPRASRCLKIVANPSKVELRMGYILSREPTVCREGELISAILRHNIKHLQLGIHENRDFVLPRTLRTFPDCVLHYQLNCVVKFRFLKRMAPFRPELFLPRIPLTVKPKELTFTLELGKQASCTIQLSNDTGVPYVFKVMNTNPDNYSVQPQYGIIWARSTCDITVQMKGPEKALTEVDCKDKFQIKSVVATANSNIASENVSKLFVKPGHNADADINLGVKYIFPLQTESSKSELPRAAPLLNTCSVCRPRHPQVIPDQNGDLLQNFIRIGLLGLAIWFLIIKLLPLMWTFMFFILMLGIKMINKLVSDSVEDWILKILCYVFGHYISSLFSRNENTPEA